MRKIYLYGLLSMLALTVLAGCKEKEEPNGENSEPEKRPVLRVTYDADDNETERTEWKYDGKNSTCSSYKNGVEYLRQEIRYYGEDYTRTEFYNGEEISKVEVHFNSDGKTVFTYLRGTLIGKTVYKKGQTIDYDYSNGTLESKSIVYLDSNGEMSREEIYNADSELTQYTFRTWEGDNYVDSTFSEGSLTSVEISQWPDEYTRERIYYSNFNNFTNPSWTITNTYADKEHNYSTGYTYISNSRKEEGVFSYGDGFFIEEMRVNDELYYNKKTETIEVSDLQERMNIYYLSDGVYVLSSYTISEYAYF